MAGLIEDIQHNCLYRNEGLDTILRKVKVASRVLGVAEIANWVESELSGSFNNLPPYRRVRGEVRLSYGDLGHKPLDAPPNIMNELEIADIYYSAGTIEGMVGNGSSVAFNIPRSKSYKYILSINPRPASMFVSVPNANLKEILNTLLNTILDWTLAMSENGVTGCDLSFTNEEKETAKIIMKNYVTNNINATNFSGNVGGDIKSRDVSLTLENSQNVIKAMHDLKKDLQQSGHEDGCVGDIIDAVIVEAEKREPNKIKVRSLLGDLRSAIVAATGSLTASGTIEVIDLLMKAM